MRFKQDLYMDLEKELKEIYSGKKNVEKARARLEEVMLPDSNGDYFLNQKEIVEVYLDGINPFDVAYRLAARVTPAEVIIAYASGKVVEELARTRLKYAKELEKGLIFTCYPELR